MATLVTKPHGQSDDARRQASTSLANIAAVPIALVAIWLAYVATATILPWVLGGALLWGAASVLKAWVEDRRHT